VLSTYRRDLVLLTRDPIADAELVRAVGLEVFRGRAYKSSERERERVSEQMGSSSGNSDARTLEEVLDRRNGLGEALQEEEVGAQFVSQYELEL